MADREHTVRRDTVSLKIRLSWSEDENVSFGSRDLFADVLSLGDTKKSVSVIDLKIETDTASDAQIIKSIVVQHFRKIFTRADESVIGPRGLPEFDPTLDHHTEDSLNSLSDKKFDTAALNPQYLRVSAVPADGKPNGFQSLSISTVSFLDSLHQPYILIFSDVSFHSAIISAFNSVLDLINIFSEIRHPTHILSRQQVFHGLNSQKVLVEFNNVLCPGYLRTNTTEYVL